MVKESFYNKLKWKNGRYFGEDNMGIVISAWNSYFILNGTKRNEFSGRDYLREMHIRKRTSFAFAQNDNTYFFFSKKLR